MIFPENTQAAKTHTFKSDNSGTSTLDPGLLVTLHKIGKFIFINPNTCMLMKNKARIVFLSCFV